MVTDSMVESSFPTAIRALLTARDVIGVTQIP
jgi:hypothetical protein